MINNKRILAIIPARGGSKGIPKKNIKLLVDKPLISYTIQEAKNSKYIDKLVISTDDNEIAEICRKQGVEIPYMRPEEISRDDTPGLDPILHMINWYMENGQTFDYVMCLQCTSPFRKASQIDESIEMIEMFKENSIVSVCESKNNPYWMKTIQNGRMTNFVKEDQKYLQRQELPVIYSLNGAIYLARVKFLVSNRGWYDQNTLAYIMDSSTSVDIDDMMDFKFAEYLITNK